ncbi:MAG: hypothetical protein WDN04_19965 [Rhodospirillales bacterium]
MQITEHAAFIAAPSRPCRWPSSGRQSSASTRSRAGSTTTGGRSAGRHSLYWAGLNKGKKSVAIDLRKPEGARACAGHRNGARRRPRAVRQQSAGHRLARSGRAAQAARRSHHDQHCRQS